MLGSLQVLLVVVLITSGGIAKLIGFAVSGSRALYVDGLTCVASIVAALFFYRFVLESSKPADKDHPYGHKGFLVASSIITLIVYSFVGGIAFSGIVFWGPSDTLQSSSIVYAALGLLFYTGAVIVSRRVEVAGETLSYFTGSEILESLVSLVSVVAGSYASPLYDYAGSLLLLAFLLYGLVSETRRILPYISSHVPPRLWEKIREEIEAEGLRVRRLRLRPCPDKSFHGDVVVEVPRTMSVEDAHRVVDIVERKIQEKYNTSLVVHIEPRSD